MPSVITVEKLRHPQHTLMSLEWQKYRLTFEGGRYFKENYLKKFSSRESADDFALRKSCTHVPAHAKAAILDIRNAIFKRMVDIIRKDGPTSYTQAVAGLNRGVDGKGNTMNSFIGQVILPELLVLGRVGVYVDKPQLMSNRISLADARKYQPYLYHYQAEDIYSWHYDEENRLDVVLLKDHRFKVDENTGLIVGEEENFRLLKLIGEEGNRQVEITLYGKVDRGPGISTSQPVIDFSVIGEPIILNLPEIPFVLMELDNSLLADVADYQISLLNLASSDVNYALKSNFPFYTEQFHPSAELPHVRSGDDAATAADGASSNSRQIKTGASQGRRYPMGADRPAFIHPSAEPLRASMDLQRELRAEIRQLVSLSLANIKPMRASAESKQEDNRGLEGGLANIGLELEFGERNIGRIWTLYESDSVSDVTIKYPDNYSMRTDADRRKEAEELRDILPTIPSPTFQKQTAKDIVTIMQGHKVSLTDLETMHKEIDSSTVVVTDPDIIKQDHEAGFVSTKTASKLRGYPEGESEQAAKDHAERAARIVTAQMGARETTRAQARGVADLDTENSSGVEERSEANDDTMRVEQGDRTRGEGQ